MQSQKYSVNQQLIETVLAWVKSGEIAIPEIQRPFVWDKTKVRNLMDSLYRGYPIGYLIVWRSPSIRLKNGSISEGKKIIIDGQQRITAMTAAILGEKVVNKNYRKEKIQISFHPIEEKFEVFNPAIAKDPSWIQDISEIISGKISIFKFMKEYISRNTGVNEGKLEMVLQKLANIIRRQIGVIELSGDLDIETVTEIFVRINSEGVILSQADFAMSKIASDEKYGGHLLRKCIDYFCHLAINPDFYEQLTEIDEEFMKSEYSSKIAWLKNENDDLYDPTYKDVLRTAFVSEFNRGKLADLVSLLSGRNFETRTYEEEIVEDTFLRLKRSVLRLINETNFKRFLMIIRSAGFIDKKMIRSRNALNFAYILFLKLREKNYQPARIEHFVKRWFVLSILTGRYSGSPESKMDFDIRKIEELGIEKHLENIEKAELSEAFWESGLIQHLNSSVSSSPYFNVFLASQVKNKDKGFLSKDITVADLILHRGDIHHIFPRNFLKKKGKTKREYNQIANYVYMQSEINIKIGDKEPREYLSLIMKQIKDGSLLYGGITEYDELLENFRQNAIPEMIFKAGIDDYQSFLEERRKLMADKIKKYYFSL